MSAEALALKRSPTKPRPVSRASDLAAQVTTLQEQVAALEAEVERLQDALLEQEFHVIDGYVVAIWPAEGGTYVATCPRLHASDQASTAAEAVAKVRDAMGLAKTVLANRSRALPPRDCGR